MLSDPTVCKYELQTFALPAFRVSSACIYAYLSRLLPITLVPLIPQPSKLWAPE